MERPQRPPIANSRGWLARVCLGSMVLTACSEPTGLERPRGAPQPASAVAPTNGLVGEWKLEGSGEDTRNNFDATLFGSPGFVAGQLGQAINLDNGPAGTGAKYAEMPNDPALDTIQKANYTISAWFFAYSQPENTSADNRSWAIALKSGQHLGLVFDDGRHFEARHYLTGDLLESATSPAAYPLNTWHHVVGVVSRTAGKVRLYVNGQPVDSNAFTANTAAKDYGTRRFRIGKAQTTWAANGRVDQVRIYNRALSAAEVADLFSETSSSVQTLPVGVFTYDGIGNGPGNDASGQKWRVLHYAPTPAGIVSDIQQADADSVLLVLLMPANRNQWEVGGTYTPSKYRQQLNRFTVAGGMSAADTAIIADAMARRRMVCYIVDEPNLDNDDGVHDISPTHVAQMAADHKARWPDCLTLARVTPSLLNSGWGDPHMAKPQGGYPKLDYAWSQFNHALAVDETAPEQAWAAESTAANQLNVGLAVSLNVWGGGLVKPIPGLPAPCWDWRDNNGPLGYILGSNEPIAVRGDGRDCSQNPLTNPYPNVVASPAFIEEFAQRVANDGRFPFLLLWNHATGTVSDSFNTYYLREDFISAFNNAIVTGRGVPAANWRTPK